MAKRPSNVAKQRILKTFSPGTDVLTVYQDLDYEEYLSVLNAIKRMIPFKKPNQNISLILFLYAGCLKFDRWKTPSPIVVPLDHQDRYSTFVDALIRTEGGWTNNTSIFQLKKIKNELFHIFDSIPFEDSSLEIIEGIQNKISEIRVPYNKDKREEYFKEKQKLDLLLSGLLNGHLRTIIKTQIPYIVHLQPLLVNLTWNGIQVQVTLKPTFYDPQTFVMIKPQGQPVGPSKWQSGTTEIALEFKALIDGDLWTPSLLTFDSVPLPFDGWPKSFTNAFSIIHDLAWMIRIHQDGEKQWIPTPRDFTTIEWEVLVNNERVEWKIKSSPGALFKGFSPSNEVLEIELDSLVVPLWHVRCRSIATMYLEVGETNEALFWINVGVEALFQHRFRQISQTINDPELFDELSSPKAYWHEAEEVVREQFPELADRISWPGTTKHVSVYQKLKYLYRRVSMKTSVNEMISNYSKVSKNRNALFHGATEKRLPVNAVEKAISSFDWIVENFTLTEDDQT